MIMQEICQPVDKAIIKAELTKEKKLRSTNKSNNEIYIITHHDSPNVMQEIGRLRKLPSDIMVEARVCLWISTSTTPWKMLIDSLLYGIRWKNRF